MITESAGRAVPVIPPGSPDKQSVNGEVVRSDTSSASPDTGKDAPAPSDDTALGSESTRNIGGRADSTPTSSDSAADASSTGRENEAIQPRGGPTKRKLAVSDTSESGSSSRPRATPGGDEDASTDNFVSNSDATNSAVTNTEAEGSDQSSTDERPKPSSNYRGVTWNKWHQKWTSQIRYGGKQHHLGVFLDPVDAARAYDAAALEHHKSKAILNFPLETPLFQMRATNPGMIPGGQFRGSAPLGNYMHPHAMMQHPHGQLGYVHSTIPNNVRLIENHAQQMAALEHSHLQGRLQHTLQFIRTDQPVQGGAAHALLPSHGVPMIVQAPYAPQNAAMMPVPTVSLLHENYIYQGNGAPAGPHFQGQPHRQNPDFSPNHGTNPQQHF